MVLSDIPNSRGEEKILRATPEFPDLPDVITDLQSDIEEKITDFLAYPWELPFLGLLHTQ